VLLLTLHHIVTDGWSIGILVHELTAIYEAHRRGQPSPLPDLPVQYADYALWQRDYLRGEVLDRHLAHWTRQLAGAQTSFELPGDRPVPARRTAIGSRQNFLIPDDLSDRIRELSRKEGSTPFMTLLTAFYVLLYRYTGHPDIIVGTPIANRNRKEIEPLIGFFINMLVMRVDLGGNPPFRTLLRRVREISLAAYTHQDLPLEYVVERLRREGSKGDRPLFRATFGLQQGVEPAPTTGLDIRAVEFDREVVRYDLSVWINDPSSRFSASWRYSTDLFSSERIAAMHAHYCSLLSSAVSRPDEPIDLLNYLTDDERARELQARAAREQASYQRLFAARTKAPVGSHSPTA
jgi:hypothetical protein